MDLLRILIEFTFSSSLFLYPFVICKKRMEILVLCSRKSAPTRNFWFWRPKTLDFENPVSKSYSLYINDNFEYIWTHLYLIFWINAKIQTSIGCLGCVVRCLRGVVRILWGIIWRLWGIVWRLWGIIWRLWGIIWRLRGIIWRLWGIVVTAWGVITPA